LDNVSAVIVAALASVLIAHYDEFLPYRWQTYVAPDKSFSIDFPGNPQEETIKVPLQNLGEAIVHTASVQIIFHCTVTDDENVTGKTPDEVLDSGLEGMLRKVQGTVLSKKRIAVQGNPGLEIRASARNNSSVDARLILVSDRLYMIMVVETGQSNDVKTVQRVFRSFKLD
jgi:hypothetical protein